MTRVFVKLMSIFTQRHEIHTILVVLCTDENLEYTVLLDERKKERFFLARVLYTLVFFRGTYYVLVYTCVLEGEELCRDERKKERSKKFFRKSPPFIDRSDELRYKHLQEVITTTLVFLTHN